MRPNISQFRSTQTRLSLPNQRGGPNVPLNQAGLYSTQNYFQGQVMRTANSFYPRNQASHISQNTMHPCQAGNSEFLGSMQNEQLMWMGMGEFESVPYCTHQCLKDMEGPSNCKECGIFKSSSGALAIKSSSKKGIGYREDVKGIMESLALESEHFKKRQLLQFGQSYSEYRNLLINWMVIKAGECELGKLTQHHAIAIMDALLSKIEVRDQDLKLVTACSLHISAKLNQKELDIPTLDTIWQRSVSFYTQHDIKLMEMFIMRHLDDNFYYLPVPLRLVQAFLDQGVLFPKKDRLSHASEFIEINQDFARHFSKTAQFIADFYIIQIKLLNVEATHAAASILAVTRKILGVEPIWSDEIEELTNIKTHEFADVGNILYEEYLLRFGTNTPLKSQSQMVPGTIKFAPLFNVNKLKNFQSPQPTRQDIAQISTGTTGGIQEGGWQTDDKSRKDLYVPPFYSQPSHFSEYKTYKNWAADGPVEQKGSTILMGKQQTGNKDVEMEDQSDKDIEVAIASAEIVVEQGTNQAEKNPFF